MNYVHRGVGNVRPYLCGPSGLTEFIMDVFHAELIEANEDGPTLLRCGDSMMWIEAGELPAGIEPWVGSVYAYVPDVDVAYALAMELGARSIAEPSDKPYHERQAGFIDLVATHGGFRPILESRTDACRRSHQSAMRKRGRDAPRYIDVQPAAGTRLSGNMRLARPADRQESA